MPQTYTQLQKQIDALKAEAEKVKAGELASVIARIKEAIKTYGITPRDLFAGRSPVKRSKARSARKVRYADGKGGVWVGRGPRPHWLRDALAAGRKLEEFVVDGRASKGNGVAKAAASVKVPKKATGRQGKKGGKVKFRDAAGNTWSGFGPQPRWLKEAIAGGKKLDNLRV